MRAPRRHPATKLVAPQGYAVEIDEALVPAILLLWHHGVPTAFSCQGSPPSPVEPLGFSGYISVTDPANTPRALELLRDRPELRNVRLRELTEFERDRRDKLRQGEPRVYAALRFEIDNIPGETCEQWLTRARAAASAAEPVLLTPEERADELRQLDGVELTPVCINFDPV